MQEKSIPKQLKEIERKFGIQAYNELLDIFSKLFSRIQELEESRENWKNKFIQMKGGLK